MGKLLALLKRLLEFELGNESEPRTDEERLANKRGADAFFDGWHQNPYPRGSRLNKFWQLGHDAAEHHHHNAW